MPEAALEQRIENALLDTIDLGSCAKCGEDLDRENDETHIVQHPNGEQIWCNTCYEDDSFWCEDCETNYDNSHHDSRQDRHGNTICQGCYEDHYFSCQHCDNIEHSDGCVTGHYANGEEADICEPCQENQFFLDVASGNFYRNEQFNAIRLTDNQYCLQDYYNQHQNEFRACHGSGEIVWLRLPDSYVIIGDRFYCRRYAEDNQIPIAPRSNSWHPPAQRPNGITARRMTLESARHQIKSKIIKEMEQRPSPGASPVHDKVYVGIELESQAGSYMLDAPHRLLHRRLPDIKIVHDGSIKGEGWEFLPPVIKKAKDWDSIKRLTETLKEFGWNAHRSCGMHLHLSHAKLNPDNPQIIRNIFRMFYWLEPIIFRCLPPSRRDNKYCYPISQYFSEKDMGQDLKLDYWYYSNFWKKKIRRSDGNSRQPHFRFDKAGRQVEMIDFGQGKYQKGNMEIDKKEHYYVGRYIGCNLHALFAKGTLELRYWPATLDYDYIKNWAQIACIMVMHGINQQPIEPIIALSKSRGNFEKAIKELGKILNLPDNLATFLKMEYRRNIENKEEDSYPEPRPSFLDVATDFRNLQVSNEFEVGPPATTTSRDPLADDILLISQNGTHYEYDPQEVRALQSYQASHIMTTPLQSRQIITVQAWCEQQHGITLGLIEIEAFYRYHFRNIHSVIPTPAEFYNAFHPGTGETV